MSLHWRLRTCVLGLLLAGFVSPLGWPTARAGEEDQQAGRKKPAETPKALSESIRELREALGDLRKAIAELRESLDSNRKAQHDGKKPVQLEIEIQPKESRGQAEQMRRLEEALTKLRAAQKQSEKGEKAGGSKALEIDVELKWRGSRPKGEHTDRGLEELRRELAHERRNNAKVLAMLGEIVDLLCELRSQGQRPHRGAPPREDRESGKPMHRGVRGTIAKVDEGRGLVLICVDRGACPQVGQRLQVYRTSPCRQWLGSVRVVDTHSRTAVARILPSPEGCPCFEPGDEVSDHQPRRPAPEDDD